MSQLERKIKRILHKRERRAEDEKINNSKSLYSHLPFYTSPEKQNEQGRLASPNMLEQASGEDRDFPGEYFMASSEVAEALAHPGMITPECLSDSGVYTSLDEMNKKQARYEQREMKRLAAFTKS